MEFDKVVYSRKSVRSFKDKKASWKDVLEAVDAANQSPFAGNHNHIKFLIIENRENIEKIAEYAEQFWINESGIVVVVCSDDTHLENLYGERGRVYSRQQAGAAIQTFLLKLVDLGLSACWVGSYSDKLIRELLKIPEDIQVEAIIPVGYEKGRIGRRKKKELENSLRWELWNVKRRLTRFDAKELGGNRALRKTKFF